MTHFFPSSAVSVAEHRLLRMGAETPKGPQETPQAPGEKLEQRMESAMEPPKTDDAAWERARAISKEIDDAMKQKTTKAIEDAKGKGLKESELTKMMDDTVRKAPTQAKDAGHKAAEKAGIRKPEGVAADAENPLGPQKPVTLEDLEARAKQLKQQTNGGLPKDETLDESGVMPLGEAAVDVGDMRNANKNRVENWELYLVPMILRNPALSQEYGELIANFRRGTLPMEFVQKVHVDTVQALQARGIRNNQIEGLRPKSEAEMHTFWQLLVDKGLPVPQLPDAQPGPGGITVAEGGEGQDGKKPKEEKKPEEKKEEPKSLDALVKGDGKWHAVPKEGGGEDGYEYSRQKDGRVYRKNAAGIAEVRSDNGKEWKSVAKEAGIDPEQNHETASIYNAVIASGKMDAWAPFKWDGKDGYQFMVSSADKKLYSQETGAGHRIQKFDKKWTNAVA